MFTFGSLFTGICGFDAPFETAGMECDWQVETDNRCQQIERRHFPNVERFGDVRECGAANLRPVDLICGGFPCQDLSVAGRRAGLAGERSGLWWEFARIIEELHPRWVVIENVPGLLSSGERRDMGILLGSLAQLGYWWAYRVLDAQYFGVAQRRRRVFIVGHSTEPTYPAKVLFEPESCERDTAPSREKGKKIADTIRGGSAGSRSHGKQSGSDRMTMVVAKTLGSHHGRNDLDSMGAYIAHPLTKRHDSSEDGTGRGLPLVIDPLTASPHADNEAQHRKLIVAYNWQSGGDVRLSFGKPNLHCGQVPAVGVRRLTPIECERLQGFPDDWTAWGLDENGERVEMSDSARYRMLGNAVATVQAEWIGRQIMAVDLTI